MTVDEYDALVNAGIVDKVELTNGRVMMGRYELAFSADQVRDAAALGIKLPSGTGAPANDEQHDTLSPPRGR